MVCFQPLRVGFLWCMQLHMAPPYTGVQASDPYPAVCCPQLKLEEDMGRLREEMAKTQKLQTREQQNLAKWQMLGLRGAGAKAWPAPRARQGRASGTCGPWGWECHVWMRTQDPKKAWDSLQKRD